MTANIKDIGYRIVDNPDPGEVEVRVIELLQEGWELLGGISVSLSESDEYRYTLYAQAMIKRPRGVAR